MRTERRRYSAKSTMTSDELKTFHTMSVIRARDVTVKPPSRNVRRGRRSATNSPSTVPTQQKQIVDHAAQISVGHAQRGQNVRHEGTDGESTGSPVP